MKCFEIEMENGDKYRFSNDFEGLIRLNRKAKGICKDIISKYIEFPEVREELRLILLASLSEKNIDSKILEEINAEENIEILEENILELLVELDENILDFIEKENKISLLKKEVNILKDSIEPMLVKVKEFKDVR